MIQNNSVGALFNGLLAKLVGWGWWGAMKWQGKHMLCSYTCIMDPLVLEMAQEIVKSVDNTITRLCATL